MGKAKNVLKIGSIDKDGREVVDSKPKTIISKFTPANQMIKMHSQIKQMIDAQAMEAETETLEESMDFDVDDGFDYEHPETEYMVDEYINFPPTGNEEPPPDPPSAGKPAEGSENIEKEPKNEDA